MDLQSAALAVTAAFFKNSYAAPFHYTASFRYNSLFDLLREGSEYSMLILNASMSHNINSPYSRVGRAAALGFLLCLGLFFSGSCLAQAVTGEKDTTVEEPSGWKVDEWYLFTSLYTKHWDDDPDHVNNQNLLGFEAHMKNNWLFGLALFDNSFGQNSQFLYAGYMWDLFGSEHFYFKLTGGLLHGYKEPYEDKIPLNGLGVAPAILPTFGFQYKFFVTEVNIAGTAAITITAGIAF
jgi:hypothetical protein